MDVPITIIGVILFQTKRVKVSQNCAFVGNDYGVDVDLGVEDFSLMYNSTFSFEPIMFFISSGVDIT